MKHGTLVYQRGSLEARTAVEEILVEFLPQQENKNIIHSYGQSPC